MWMGLGSNASLFHLLTHGVFKAGLFLAAGSIIYYLHEQDKHHKIDAQDVQVMGGLYQKIPLVAITYSLFAFGLIGLPFTNGFFSKENIAGFLFEQSKDSPFQSVYFILLGVLALGILLSTLYASRQIILLFSGSNRSNIPLEKSKIDFLQILPMVLLAISSLWFFISLQPFHLADSNLLNFLDIQSHDAPSLWIFGSMGLWIAGFGLAYFSKHKIPVNNYQFVGNFWPIINKTGIGFAHFVQLKIDQSIDRSLNYLVQFQVILAHGLSWLDRWIIDGILVKGISKISYLWGGLLNKWQSGKVQSYWTWMVITFGLFLLYYLL
jgi:NADH-quinone oxidoreductase subunit L